MAVKRSKITRVGVECAGVPGNPESGGVRTGQGRLSQASPTVAFAQELSPDARALETESQMTADERFGMLVSVMGSNILFPARRST
jgi:hypothetical protein